MNIHTTWGRRLHDPVYSYCFKLDTASSFCCAPAPILLLGGTVIRMYPPMYSHMFTDHICVGRRPWQVLSSVVVVGVEDTPRWGLFCVLPDAACVVLGGLACKALMADNDCNTCSGSPLARCSVIRLLVALTLVLLSRK